MKVGHSLRDEYPSVDDRHFELGPVDGSGDDRRYVGHHSTRERSRDLQSRHLMVPRHVAQNLNHQHLV